MVRHTKKNKRGGANLEGIQSQLTIIQEQLRELKDLKCEPIVKNIIDELKNLKCEPIEPLVEPVFEPPVEPVFEPQSVSQVEPVSEPVSEPVFEPPVESPVEPPVEPLVETQSEPVFEPVSEPVFEPPVEAPPVVKPMSKDISKKPIPKPWVTNKEIKFKDGEGGRVLLAFSRVISHIDNNIKKGSTTKDWTTIKEKLINANSENEVQDIINQYKVKFASNYVLGGKTKRKGRRNKRKTHKRR
jgi:hypothetical protein